MIIVGVIIVDRFRIQVWQSCHSKYCRVICRVWYLKWLDQHYRLCSGIQCWRVCKRARPSYSIILSLSANHA